MFNFNQFINESKDHEFDSLEVGDNVQIGGKTYPIEKIGYGIIHLPSKYGDIKVNKNQWRERGGRVIKKNKNNEEK